MSFCIHELTRAQEDIAEIFAYIHKRSPEGAAAWLDAYDAMTRMLETHAVSLAAAPESRSLDVDVKQTFFKTR